MPQDYDGAIALRMRSTVSPDRRSSRAEPGPRASALIYLHAGLRTGASAEDVLARADADDAPFARSEKVRAWVADGLAQLSR